MAGQVRLLGGFAVQAAFVLLGVTSILVLARDGLHFFLQDGFGWLLWLNEASIGAVLDQPAVWYVNERIIWRLQSLLSALGVDANLHLHAHWKQVVVLLALVLLGYAHARRDFVRRPAASAFQYVNALLCAYLGGLMAGTVHLLNHPGMLAWPFAAFLVFYGLNSAWRCAVARAPRQRIVSASIMVLLLGAAALIALLVVNLENPSVDSSFGPWLVITALMAAGLGAWWTAFGLEEGKAADASMRWIDHPGRRTGFRILATLSLALVIAGIGHATWGMARETHTADLVTSGEVFRDCLGCPEMVAIPAGVFAMGTSEAQAEQLQAAWNWSASRFSDEFPARNVAVAEFAMARTEVTIAEFQAFVDATGYSVGGMCWGLHNGQLDFHRHNNWRDPGYQHEADHPVVCVNWTDAQAYVRWLSLRTGETYRLPTEAEWEYAARAGTETHYHWGDAADAGCSFMNGADATAQRAFPDWTSVGCDDGVPHTASVASYQANAFGLFDMKGNVWEWVQDCYGAYDPAHGGEAVVTRDCPDRVIRGGSWNYGPEELRSANREPHRPTTRGSGLGFRVARTISAPGS